jgi:hypothetical protein
MSGCIEDLFTQYLWDFDRLKGLNCSPVEECFQDFAHGYPLCCYYNIKALQVQHTKTQCRRWVHTAVLRNDSGPEVSIWEIISEVSPLPTDRQ